MENLRPKFIAMLVCLSAASAALATPSSVSLVFTDLDATPNQVNVLPGGTFNVRLNLVTSTATGADVQKRTTGLDYYFTMLGGVGSGYFRIINRDVGPVTSTSYTDVLTDDTTVESAAGGLLDPDNGADPDLPDDLGATLENPMTTSNGAGTFLVANYTIGLAPNTPYGPYVLQTTAPPGTGWVGPNPDFNEDDFDAHAAFNIVVPEPASIALLGWAFIGLRRKR